jgi:signal transduction histidine kinase
MRTALFVFFAILLNGAPTLTAQSIIINDHFRHRNVAPEYMKGEFEIDTLAKWGHPRLTLARSANKSLGYVPEPIWFHFRLSNPLPRKKTIVLSIGRKDQVEFSAWLQSPNAPPRLLGAYSSIKRGGYPFRLSNGFEYILELEPGEHHVWIRSHNKFLSSYLCFDLYDMNTYAKKGRRDVLYFGAFSGVLLIFAFLSVVLYFAYKANIYLYYLVYLVSLASLVAFDYSVDYGLIPLILRLVLSWVVGFNFSRFLMRLNTGVNDKLAGQLTLSIHILWVTCIFAAIFCCWIERKDWIRHISMFADVLFIWFGVLMFYMLLLNLRAKQGRVVETTAYWPMGLVFCMLALRNLGILPNYPVFQYAIFWGFFIEVILLVASLARGFSRLEISRRELEQNLALEKQQKDLAVAEIEQKTKDNISKELHNDIAASLSGLRILSKVAYEQIGPDQPEVRTLVEKINKTAQSSADSLSDLIWTVKPHENYLNDMADRFRDYCNRMLDSKQIDYSLQIPSDLPIIDLGVEKRRNLYLIFKEAVNNAVKHSNCTYLTATLDVTGGHLTMIITDNGKGFDSEEADGMGLQNMINRAASIGAKLIIDSEEGTGTKILFYLKNDLEAL